MERAEKHGLHHRLERLSSLIRASLRELANESGLKLVQLEALIYLSKANRYSDTPMALTEYLGVTKGTVSQTLKALESRGLVGKAPDPKDARIKRCRLTPSGRALAERAVPAPLLGALSESAAKKASTALEELLARIQIESGRQSFGMCRTCSHFEALGRQGRCGLTGEGLRSSELVQICREHLSKSP